MLAARHNWISSLIVCAATTAAYGQDRLAPAEFGRLRELIRPHQGESNWRRVHWLTSLHEARVQAAAEGKPILLWSGGGAPPLGGC